MLVFKRKPVYGTRKTIPKNVLLTLQKFKGNACAKLLLSLVLWWTAAPNDSTCSVQTNGLAVPDMVGFRQFIQPASGRSNRLVNSLMK
ncbi:hypothetical protein L596_021384 [Steinernema carpocapsae]|uniref:Uncharacterized protein n=1 Tax=Steinernema carpocapsae TaxID=34508 RepID=A0A4U5MIJ4_STECR|nr:hypothetical protein L596_021384 [Steinernema carpocapsae]